MDADRCAAISFDWHGFDPDERRNPHGLLHLYEHRVTARPALLVRTADLKRQTPRVRAEAEARSTQYHTSAQNRTATPYAMPPKTAAFQRNAERSTHPI